MGHKGLREFSGEEIGNVSIGQLGFEMITSTGSAGTSGLKDGKDYFCAIKAVLGSASGSSTSEIVITAESLQGDDLSTTVMLPGDIIWGCFNYVNITTNTSSLMKIIAYHGKKSS
ncbi:hypothetical protein [Acinetobacter sp.]|uniref:hypothetical protein n=1 Tax=Acinetobacter sp. TaxID=472 RepID=UPI000C0A45C2|nr:hypothetical protein [Acinetobacter sp.]MAK31674.1 hypothetical protein [Acinetobacter sp.]QDP47191.1 MAG: hypothetical protein GOVbin655_25 [Prokaryotic dsDNA virus sp.]|tara:strand:- start:1328 stop:1672 length:345 start_codon:yes stop_codon:yes gene_type:complete